MPDLWLVALSPMNMARAVLQALPRLPVPGVSFTVHIQGICSQISTHMNCVPICQCCGSGPRMWCYFDPWNQDLG
jgi:hypothetical protein